MAQTRDIKYLNRDFDNLRGQLVEFTKNYFSDTYNDFSPTSPGVMMIELASYVADVMAFYQDTQLQETFIQHAKDPRNLIDLAYMLGYKPKITTVSNVNLEVSQIVTPNPYNLNEPDWDQAVRISENTQIQSRQNDVSTFIVDQVIDFRYSSSMDPTNVVINEFDETLTPLSFRLVKNIPARSGAIKSLTKTFTTAQPFSTVVIEDVNIVGILDIVDENGSGDKWYEVPFLGQETVFIQEANANADRNVVRNRLTLRKVPKRFVTRYNSAGNLIVQFGSGINPDEDTTFTPQMNNVGLGTNTGISRLDFAYDPSNFLYTRTYGLSPTGTTLRIRYIVGGSVQSNVPANTITRVINIETDSTDPDILDRIFFNNPGAADGGSDGDTIEELRQNSLRAFNEQNRTVTLEDFVVRCYSLPSNLGSVAKVYAIQDQIGTTNRTDDIILDSNPLSLSVYTLSYNLEGKLTSSSPTLKSNLKNYLSQFTLLTDAVNLKDAFIINFGLEYEIIVYPDQVGREVLLRCKNELASFFDTSRWNINQPINISEIYVLLDKVKGVQTVQNVRLFNKVGGVYSPYGYDFEGATKNNTIYPSLDPCIFELKYPNRDLRGRLTNI